MNEVKCLGSERSIWHCPFKNVTSEECQHTEDASVRCNIPYMGLETSVRAGPPENKFEILDCDTFSMSSLNMSSFIP